MASKKLVATMKEKAEAVQVIVSEVPNLQAAFAYAIDVTQKQGGATIASPGWDEESRTARHFCLDLSVIANLKSITITGAIRKA
jgi:hypothetical protein